jgi:hypothetical protein
MKTIEEAAIEYAQRAYSKIAAEAETNIDGAILGASANGFISGFEFAQRWISVEEELPEKYINVLVKIPNGYPEGRATTTFLMEAGEFAYNLHPSHWRYIELK